MIQTPSGQCTSGKGNPMTRTHVLFACLLLLAWCFAAFAGDRDTTVVYVAPDGNDEWSGTRAAAKADGTDGPFATLEGARKAVRELKTKGLPVKVLVRGGKYSMFAPVVFGPDDSGTAAAPISYEAYPGETPVLCASWVVRDWFVRPGNLWVSFLPWETRRAWPVRQAWVNEKRRELKAEPEGTVNVGLAGAEHSESLEPGQWYFDRASTNMYYRPLRGENPKSLELAVPMAHSLILFRGDVAAGKHVEYINVSGLTFTFTRKFDANKLPEGVSVPAVVHGIGARNCSVTGCTFRHLASTSVWFEPSPESNVVADNMQWDVMF